MESSKLNVFQIVLLVGFGFCFLVGVILFALYKGGGNSLPAVTLWGPFGEQLMQNFVGSEAVKAGGVEIRYVQKNPVTLQSDLVDALARGQGPDMVILPHEAVFAEADKLSEIPYTTYPQRTFQDNFVSGADMFLTPTGVRAVPLSIDPLVLYWNRRLFDSAGIASPPTTWAQVKALSAGYNQIDNVGSIKRTFVALGETDNINHSKDLLSLLLLQAGAPIASQQEGKWQAMLDFASTVSPAVQAISFYTDFTDVRKNVYSWNKALPMSQDAFTSEILATYIGFASEYSALRTKNPNLSYDVAPMPQAEGTNKLTFGRFYAVAVPRLVAPAKAQSVLQALTAMTGAAGAQTFSNLSGLPPARRDLLSATPPGSAAPVFYRSALIARAWYDPSPSATDKIFDTMVEYVNAGRGRVSDAVRRAQAQLQAVVN